MSNERNAGTSPSSVRAGAAPRLRHDVKIEVERALLEYTRLLGTSLSAIGDGVIGISASGLINFLNPVASELTGWTSEEARGRRFDEVFVIVDRHSRVSVQSPVVQVLRDGVAVSLTNSTTVLVRRDGSEIPIDKESAAPVRGAEGRPSGIVLIFRDTIEKRRAEADRDDRLMLERTARAEAESASRGKDEFLATASHELRTPLNAILGWARLLRSGQLDQSGYLRALETIERNAKCQVQLIEDILDGSRIITGNLRLDIRPVDMVVLVRAALDAVRPAADAKNITLLSTLDPNATRIIGDPDRLQQIVWNLANNAIKFTPKGGAVEVHLERSGTDISLVVKDTGKGINGSFLPHVFERFRQAEGSTSRRHGGLGLGLALVRYLVEAHGGSVRADSEGEDRGATFTVTLPAQAVLPKTLPSERSEAIQPKQNDGPSIARESLRGATILVVDDEADARDLVATVLRSRGARVTTAATAERGLEFLINDPPAILLSDIGMPNTDGYEFIRRVRALVGTRGAQTPAVALTAYAREEDRRRALEAGFQTHVSKPVEPSELLRIVTNLLQYAHKQPPEERAFPMARADTFLKFERILDTGGIEGALRFLNSRTPHRFTGLYKFDLPMLHSLHLVDSYAPDLTRDEDAPLSETYCSIVSETERTFTTEDALSDDQLRTHPARKRIISYCGVLLRDKTGRAAGTLCHFDLVPCDVPLHEIGLMETAAPLFMRELEKGAAG